MKLKLLFSSLLITFLLCSENGQAQSVFINEIHYDNTGTDTEEAIEIAGTAGTDLSGWSIVLYNGANGTVYNTISIAGNIPDQQNGYGTLIQTLPSNGLQNGAPDGIALVDSSATVIQFLSYEGVLTAVDGPASGRTSTDIGVSESGSTPVGASLQLSGTGTTAQDFSWEINDTNSYGAINTNQVFGTLNSNPIINEFVVNHTGEDTDEYIEILGTPDTDLSEYTIIEIEGDENASGVINAIITLGTTDSNGYFTTPFQNNAFENGSLAFLLVKNFTGTLGDDLDTDDDGTLDSTPWDSIVDDIGIQDGETNDINYATVTLLPSFDGSRFTVGGASRFPNGNDTDTAADWARNDFDGQGLPSFPIAIAEVGEAINTPGTENKIADIMSDVVVLINEIDVDTQGSDMLEFVELYDGGIGNSSLNGYVLVFYNGATNQSYTSFDLSGFTTNTDGFFVVGNSAVSTAEIVFPENGLQNGADAIALYKTEASNFPDGTPVTTENIIDAIVYDTNDEDDIELLVLLNTGESQLNEDINGNKDLESLQRIPDGQGGARNTSSYIAKTPTPGISNEGVIVTPGEIIPIATARATTEGTPVTITGVLTATDSFNGPAFIQDATGGIAIFDQEIQSGQNLKIGDSITLTGVRVAFNDQVQVDSVIEVIAHGVAQTPIIPLDITLAELVDHPGELVRVLNTSFPNPGDLLFGNSNYTLTDSSGAGELRIDNDVDTVAGKQQPVSCPEITGVVGRFRDFFQLLPRKDTDIPCATEFIAPGDTIGIPREETFDVVTWNIEWFGDEGNSPVGNNPMSDEIQRDSTAVVLRALNADIYAVQEIADDTLFDQLVNQLPGYDYILSDAFSNPSSTSSRQKVGFIYNTETVSVVNTRPMFTSIHPLYNGGDDTALVDYPSTTDRFYASGRLPFLMTADVTINGSTERIDLIALHARANRGGADAQNRYDMRQYDVEVLKDSLDINFATNKVILLGDYNDDVDETVADITSTTSSFQAYVDDPTNYTIVSSALSEAGLRSFISRENMIDHIMISNELTESYIEPSVTVHYDVYDTDYIFNTSDHLPVSVRFSFEPETVDNECVGDAIIAFEQGRRRDGRRISRGRSNPKKALGNPKEHRYFNFVSLGFGGSITIQLNHEIFDNPDSNEFAVIESTGFRGAIPCAYFPETAEVFASQDGVNFVSLGTTCQDGEFDLETGKLSSATHIRVVDVSNKNDFYWPFADGYDLDAIICLDPTVKSSRVTTSITQTAIQNPSGYESELFNKINVINDMSLSIHPNPVIDLVSLNFDVFDTEEMEISMVDITGKTVYVQKSTISAKTSSIQIDLTRFPKGFYIVTAKSMVSGFSISKKISNAEF